jgi:hypothetical protein
MMGQPQIHLVTPWPLVQSMIALTALKIHREQLQWDLRVLHVMHLDVSSTSHKLNLWMWSYGRGQARRSQY